MKHQRLWLCAAVLLTIFASAIGYYTNHQEGQPIRYTEETEKAKGRQTGVERQLAMLYYSRAYPDPYFLGQKYEKAWETAQAMKNRNTSARMQSPSWTSIGPSQTIGGRVLSIAIDPNNIDNLFIGTASGGIWKSTDAAASWTYVPTGLPVLGVASITYHPTNSNILIAGTGEVYRTGSGTGNIGYNVWKARGTYGIGIIRSTDGGLTWTKVMPKVSADMFAIQMIKFDPTNPNIVYACATDGLYKSIDAGATWNTTPLIAKNYVSDIAIDPTRNDTMIIAVGNMVDTDKGIYRTKDGGANWTKLTNTNGLPTSFNGYIRLDNVGTALFASIGGISGNELYMCTTGATDFGLTWIAKTSSAHAGSQYWFGHDLAVSPTMINATDRYIIMGGVSYYRYTNTSMTTNAGSRSTTGSGVHADVHDIKYASGSIVYIACDGGIYKSTTSGGSTGWANRNSGLSATQFYASIATHPTNPSTIIGGLQDNGVIKYNGSTWAAIAGGDGASCAINQSDGTKSIYSNDARAVYYDNNGSQTQPLLNLGYGYSPSVYDDRTGFVAPLAISKSNPSYVYVASDNLHISTNGGGSYTRADPSAMTRPIEQTNKTAIALAISHTNHQKIYVSTSPYAQATDNSLIVNGQPNLLRSTNAHDNANYLFTSVKGTAPNNLPDRFVNDIAIDPANDNIVFVVLGGFGTSHVYMTTDGGTNWTSIGSGDVLPDVPFNAIHIDPVNPNILYVGTDFGVYMSPNRGGNWFDYNGNLQDLTLVMDIQSNSNMELVLATHGKGAYIGPAFTGTLPVIFTTFKGEHQDKTNVLRWTTGTETGVKQYELEKSIDGNHFTKFAVVAAGSNTSSYQYNDRQSANAPAITYYRLKAVDHDGSFSYSGVVVLQQKTAISFAVNPNPFHDQLRINIGVLSKQPVVLQLLNSKGALMRWETHQATEGMNIFEMKHLNNLPKGIYFLEAIINHDRRSKKLMKQ